MISLVIVDIAKSTWLCDGCFFQHLPVHSKEERLPGVHNGTTYVLYHRANALSTLVLSLLARYRFTAVGYSFLCSILNFTAMSIIIYFPFLLPEFPFFFFHSLHFQCSSWRMDSLQYSLFDCENLSLWLLSECVRLHVGRYSYSSYAAFIAWLYTWFVRRRNRKIPQFSHSHDFYSSLMKWRRQYRFFHCRSIMFMFCKDFSFPTVAPIDYLKISQIFKIWN